MSVSSSLSGACGPASEGARPFAGEPREAYLSRLLAVYYLRATIVDQTQSNGKRPRWRIRAVWVKGAPPALVRRTKSKPFDTSKPAEDAAMEELGVFASRLLAEVHSGVGAGAKRKAPCQETSTEVDSPESFMARFSGAQGQSQEKAKGDREAGGSVSRFWERPHQRRGMGGGRLRRCG